MLLAIHLKSATDLFLNSSSWALPFSTALNFKSCSAPEECFRYWKAGLIMAMWTTGNWLIFGIFQWWTTLDIFIQREHVSKSCLLLLSRYFHSRCPHVQMATQDGCPKRCTNLLVNTWSLTNKNYTLRLGFSEGTVHKIHALWFF